MDNVVAYILLTTALALVQIRENYNAFNAKRHAHSVGMTFTVLEICWVFVSLFFIFTTDASQLEASVAGFYVAINVCGWVAGHYLYKPTSAEPMDLSVIPDSFFFAAMFACVLLFIYGVFVLTQSVPHRRDTPITQFLLNNISMIIWVPTGFIITRELFVTLGRYFVTKNDLEIIEAIERNDTCSDYFGKVIDVTFDFQLSAENPDEFVFAFHVDGIERNGTLIAHFANLDMSKHIILFGVIIAEDGETIELDKVVLHV